MTSSMPCTTDYYIENTTPADLDLVLNLFDQAVAYQKQKNVPVYHIRQKEALRQDMANGLQYKVVSDLGTLCIFTICFSDPVIWTDLEKGDAIYLHRIIANPDFKGQRQVEKIVAWAVGLAREKGLKFIRMDTWADNPVIISYYKNLGFRFIKNYTIPENNALGIQYSNLCVALLEMELTEQR